MEQITIENIEYWVEWQWTECSYQNNPATRLLPRADKIYLVGMFERNPEDDALVSVALMDRYEHDFKWQTAIDRELERRFCK